MLNWYDIVVVGALLYGVWSGIQAGLTGEIIRVVGLVLMFVLAAEFHQTVGDWINMNFSLSKEAARLIAYVSIAVAVYLITLAIRLRTRQRMQQLKVAVLLENVGGGFAGAIRVALIMAWVTVVVSLSTSNFLYDQIGVESRFGSLILDQFPAARAAMERNSSGKPWFLQEMKRKPEPNYDVSGPTNTQPLETTPK